MKLLSIERARGGSAGVRDIAKFSVQITDDLRLVGVRLVETDSGRRLVYAPSAGGSRCATFSTELAKALTALASESLNNLMDRQVNAYSNAS
ncbi:hypothetical protein DES32_0836 [Methylovirgula ligni]|uniref:Uncharacterized protein n=1 Tax=Methylovirgula ligni TaxID=569860 RepID=A0A3D9Z7S5_9HYPH|nr:hypothetical protein [Methylovirgula ligni]REF89609.1 hypothetical protein DES32_0836 [Methylovirgula ligni]